jgi:hypothetical protein
LDETGVPVGDGSARLSQLLLWKSRADAEHQGHARGDLLWSRVARDDADRRVR